MFLIPGDNYVHKCSDKTVKDVGCINDVQTIGEITIRKEICVCTGNLCNSGEPTSEDTNSALTKRINSILVFLSFIIAFLRFQ